MQPMFVLAQRYADATRSRVAESAQPGAPVTTRRRRRLKWARRRARRAEPR
jgi:hypothetical protein